MRRPALLFLVGTLALSAGVLVFALRRPQPAPKARRRPPAIARDAGPPDAGPEAEREPEQPPAPEPRAGDTRVVLLHTAGTYGEYAAHPNGGLARRAGYVRSLRSQGGAVLSVDVGDLLGSPAPSSGELAPPPDAEVDRRAELVLAATVRGGIDALVPGAVDLALGLDRLAKLYKAAKAPVLAANLIDPFGHHPFARDRIVEAGGVAVGLFGIVAPSPETEAKWRAQRLTVADPWAEARDLASSLRKRGARVVVALAWVEGGPTAARAIFEGQVGIDAVVVGRHAQGAAPPEVRPPLMFAPRPYGTYVGRVLLDVGDSGVRTFHDEVKLTPAIESDPSVRALVRRYTDGSRRLMDRGEHVGIGWRAPWSLPPLPDPPPRTQTKPAEELLERWSYGSNGACALCHKDAADQWKTTPHAVALETLVNVARQTDPRCLGCHSTGFAQPGGTLSVRRATTYFADVGCEACHGPSGDHVRSRSAASTRRKVPAAVCTGCHNPAQSPEPFDYARGLEAVLGPGHGRPL